MQTPKFVIRDGCISMANVSSLPLRHLDDVIDGRDGNGAPYSRFTVEARFFDGYSVAGIPPEFAKALGCKPDEGKSVRIANLPRLPRSVNTMATCVDDRSIARDTWPIHSGNSAPSPASVVRVTIRGLGLVDLTVEDEGMERSSTNHADTILARMKNRRRAL